MLRLGCLTERTCAGVSRREVLQVGGLGALGLSLPQALRAEAAGRPASDLSVLVVFLRGGVSHIDTWDVKPEAPVATARGELRAIETNVSGIRFCELLPLLARQ